MKATLRVFGCFAILFGYIAAIQATTIRTKADIRIVIDVGHIEGGGAQSARGVAEYDFNLRLATEIVDDLKKAGYTKTVLFTTNQKGSRGLYARPQYANRIGADLFISIHHDAVPDHMIKKWRYKGEEHQYNDDFPGYSLFISKDNGDVRGSLLFARTLGSELQRQGLRHTTHYVEKRMGRRQRTWADPEAGVYYFDDLVVLERTRMPAVLLEAGSIVNRDEETALNTEPRRKLIRDSIVKAVETYFTK
jgi:N-acetylmuramoyl-L-alanine amidase